MILHKVELRNFRSYHGFHEIHLKLENEPNYGPITLIGGLNGAGKTSLLEGITFALLGVEDAIASNSEMRSRPNRQIIERAKEGIINREALENGANQASVSLFFTDVADGNFVVHRTWHYDDRRRFRDEKLHVEINDDYYSSLTQDQYEDFLKHRVPQEVVKFFFFDGEKIQDIAQDDVGESLIKGMNCLLGFHVLEALETDMNSKQEEYRTLSNKKNRQEEELSELRTKETKLNNQLKENADRQADLEERIAELHEQSRDLKEKLAGYLGHSNGNPQETQRQLSEAEAEVRKTKEDILRTIDTSIVPLMPFELLIKLQVQLNAEEIRSKYEEGMRRVQPQRDRLIHNILGHEAPKASPPLQECQRDFFQNRILQEWDQLFNPPPEGIAANIIHGYLSTDERSQVIVKGTRALNSDVPDIRKLFDQLDDSERRVHSLQQTLLAFGDGEEANRLLKQKTEIDKQLGEAEYSWDSTKRQIQSISNDAKEIQRQIKNKEEDLLGSGQADEKANFVRRIKKAIHKYQESLRLKKRNEVARYLTEMYRRLARKNDVVDRIEIDEATFRPKLIDRKGNAIPLHSLSAGEREIYALSLLWALNKTSRRQLPVVIDTPLARLDSKHRAAIVENYLPNAGHQVVVLSTDTEIDRDFYDLIKSHVGRKLRLEFDPSTERTSVHEGYFRF
jgi:DNA sulfur modification protein DndD